MSYYATLKNSRYVENAESLFYNESLFGGNVKTCGKIHGCFLMWRWRSTLNRRDVKY